MIVLYYFFMLIIVMFLTVVAIMTDKKSVRMGILLGIILVGIISLSCLSNKSLNFYLRKNLNPATEHKLIDYGFSSEPSELRLPKGMVLEERYSSTGAYYLTDLTIQDVEHFYRDLEDVTDLSINESEINFLYKNQAIVIKFLSEPDEEIKRVDIYKKS